MLCKQNYFDKITPSNIASPTKEGYMRLVKIAEEYFANDKYEEFAGFLQEGQYFIALWAAHLLLEYGNLNPYLTSEALNTIKKYSDSPLAPDVASEEKEWLKRNGEKYSNVSDKQTYSQVIKKGVGELLGMGGPWVSELYVDEIKISGLFLDNGNAYHESDKSKLAFVRYRKTRFTYFQWQMKFSIEVLDLANKKAYLNKRKFNSLCVYEFTENLIKFCTSFCFNPEERATIVFDLNNGEWLETEW